MAERDLSLRQVRNRTGVDTDTLSRMRQNEVPRLDKVEAFARGFGLDINAWRQLAGYDPVEDTRPPLDVIREAAADLEYDPELENIRLHGFDGPDIDPDDRRVIESILRAVYAEERRKRGA